MNFYVQLMPLVFISLYANCWIKKKLSYEQVIVSVDLDRSVEGQTKFYISVRL